MKKPGILTPKQELFCQEFSKSLNQTQAAIKAGYSEKNADSIASRLVRKSQVIKRLGELMTRRNKKYDISADRVLKELARIAFSDVTDYVEFSADGIKLKDSDGLTRNQSAAVAEVSETVTQNGGTTNFKLHNKVKALELLGKHLKLFADRVEHGLDKSLEDLIVGTGGADDRPGGNDEGPGGDGDE